MPSIENVNRWIEQVGIDYYTQFIKAWIPFNAWYNVNYPLIDSDRAILNEIKRSTNSFFDGIVSLIKSTSPEGVLFKGYISDLHKSLQDCSIRNGQTVISFESIIIEKNPDNQVNYDYRGVNYYIKRTDNGRSCSFNIAITRSGTNLFTLNQSKFDFTEVEGIRSYASLSEERKKILKANYLLLNPYKPTNLLSTPSTDSYIEIGSYKFINNINVIAKGLVEILYLLRCSLFHGELVPNEQSKNVYKYSFEILCMLLDKIR